MDVWSAFVLVLTVSDVLPYKLEASETAQIMKRRPLAKMSFVPVRQQARDSVLFSKAPGGV